MALQDILYFPSKSIWKAMKIIGIVGDLRMGNVLKFVKNFTKTVSSCNEIDILLKRENVIK